MRNDLTYKRQIKMEPPSTVVLYPSPEIGHLVSMVELGKLIHTHHPSLSIVILLTPAPSKTQSTAKYISTISDTSAITFHRLPAVAFPPDFSSHFIDLAFGIPELYNPVFRHALVTISEKSTIKAVILDFFSNAGFQVAKSLDLPTYYFYTGGASGVCLLLYLPTIHNTTSKSIKDLSTFLNVPGVPPIHVSDVPEAVNDRESNSYRNFLLTAGNMAKSSGIVVNSFVGLEEKAVDTLRDGFPFPYRRIPPVYLIGPVLSGSEKVDGSENECLKWLNSQPSKSVVFLCFGSRGVFTKDQLTEIATGVEKSRQRFLWVLRDPPASYETESSSCVNELGLDDLLPEGFLTRTVGKGLVVKNWAPQTAILGHDSVGGFVSHCGWNSVLEAVVAGVPMVAWPLYAEQKMNRLYLVEEMKVALAVAMAPDGFVTAEAVEETVRGLMEGEEGRVVRKRMLEMSRRAAAAVAEDGGSARVDLLKFTQSVVDRRVAKD